MAFAKKAAKKAAPKKAGKKVVHRGPVAKRSAPKKGAAKKGCYFTTACVEYHNLPDDCYQLQTLRNFRDNILLKNNSGKRLINLYYNVAPKIVSKLKADKNHDLEFLKIFNHINKACSLIYNKRYKSAKDEYIFMVENLMRKYLKS